MNTRTRISRAAHRLSDRLPRIAYRGQLGPAQQIDVARLTGARR